MFASVFCKSEAGVALCIADTVKGPILSGTITACDVMGKLDQHLKLDMDQHTSRKESRGQHKCLCISQVYEELMKIIAQG